MSDDVDYPQGCQPIVNSTNVSQQVERLRKLATCLYDCKPNNSEEVQNPQRFQRLFYHLSQDAFLENANTDFRIYLSLCLSNILRVYHPEIPTSTADDLKEVYIYVFRTLRGLGDVTTDSPKFKNYFHLVEAIEKILHPLSEMSTDEERVLPVVLRALVKSVLQTTCGKGWRKNADSEGNTEKKAGVSSENGEEMEQDDEEEDDENAFLKVKNSLITIATTALSEVERVPNEVLDVFFYHIIEPQRTNFREAYSLAQIIIAQCMESDLNSLAQSIQEVMVTGVKEAKLPEEFEMTGSENRQKYFELLRALHNISYDLVSTAIGELNFWLQSENEKYRKEAVTIVGFITRQKNCRLGMDSNDVTWSAFCNTAYDSDEAVRWEFVEQSKHVLMSLHSHLRGHVINCLHRMSTEPSERIRIHVVRVVTDVAKSKLEVISDKMLKACADRMRDKKSDVRIHAIKSLMDLYHNVMTGHPKNFYGRPDSESTLTYTESDKDCVRFIPTAVFHVYRITQKLPAYTDSRLTIERYIHLYFIPYNLEPERRVQLMFEMFRGLDDIGTVMFGDYIIRSSQLRRAMIGIICQVSQAAEQSMGDQLRERIRRIAQIFPDAIALEKLLFHFVNMMAEDERVFNGMKRLMAESYTSSELQSASSFVMGACSKNKMFNKTRKEKERMETQKSANEPDLTVTFRHFINRITPIAFDVPAAKEIVRIASETVTQKVQLKRSAEACFDRDLILLKLFSEHFAHLFNGDDTIENIRSEMLNTEEPKAVEAALHALSKIFNNSMFKKKLSEEETRKERWFLLMSKDLKELIMRTEPQNRRSCKLSARLLAGLLGKEKSVEFFDGVLTGLMYRLNIETEGVSNAYQVLAEIFHTDPAHFFPQIMDIIETRAFGPRFLVSPMADDDDPIEFNELVHIDKQPWPKLTVPKVYAAKFATKVLISYPLSVFGSEEKRRMEQATQSVVENLGDIIQKKGDLGIRQCDVEKARLRANAAACLLKIASIPQYRPRIDTRLYKNLCYHIIDDAYCIRQHYVSHVKKELGRRLPIEFAACYGLVNLGLTDEDGENKAETFKTLCISHMQQAFADRTDRRADEQKLEGARRAMFCSETVIAYVVWLLANYEKLDKIEESVKKTDSEEELELKCANANLLSELQENLWLVIDALRHARCDMQQVWRVLEKLKTCGDKPFRTENELSVEGYREHNKKLWALSDLGIAMMLYRAKLQMQDMPQRDPSYNLQFFYMCNSRDKADPSNVYSPDILLSDEQTRNGKLPRPGRVFRIGDLTAGFTPPPHGNDTTSSVKNVSKRGAPSGNMTKRKQGKKVPAKRRSGGSLPEVAEDSDGDGDDFSTSHSKPRGKRGVYDPPESEDEEMEEVIPLPKRRGPAPAPASSSVNGNGTSSLKNRTSGGRRDSGKAQKKVGIEESDDEEEEKEDGGLSLDQIVISPIQNDTGRPRRSTRSAVLTASTPVVPVKPKTSKRKREAGVEEEPEEEEEVGDDAEEAAEEDPEESAAPAPKRRSSGRRSAPSSAKKKTPTKKASPKKKKVTPTPKTNKYNLPMEEDGEEEAPKAAPPTRTRHSARLSKT